jgi:Mrp family chromosome partitioning ATPase
MELNRLVRILKARWPVVALISLAGFAAAFAFTLMTRGAVDPVYEGVISIEFELEGEETVDDLAGEIEGERRLAQFATQDLLVEYQNASIVADTAAARLVFYARGASSGQASERVGNLAQAYLDSDPIGGRDAGQQLAEFEQQAEELQAEIQVLQPSLSPAQEELHAEHELLDRQIGRLKDEIVALTVADAGATGEERAGNETRRNSLRATLQELQAEKAALPSPPSLELSPSDQLRLSALQRRLEILTADYQRLALRTMGVTTRGNVQPVTVNDLTPQPPNPLANGARGLLAGAGVSLIALFVMTRTRREVWLPSDLPMPMLGVVPRRKVSNLPGPSWYDSVEGGRRKESVQALRTAVEGVIDGPTALAVVGGSVDPMECQTLAVDVAASFASAGRMVLVVDADYSEGNQLNEFNVGEPTLESVLRLPSSSDESLTQRTSHLLAEAIQIRPGLVIVPSGSPPPSPADALAGRQFRVFLDQARAMFDLVVVVAGGVRSAAAQVVVQRTGSVLLAVTPGKTTSTGVDAWVSDLSIQRVRPIGAVMISGTDNRSDGPFESLSSRLSRGEGDSLVPVDRGESPVNRLRFYPTPMEKGAGDVGATSLQSLIGGLSEGLSAASNSSADKNGSAENLGTELLAILGNADVEAREPVAEYLVTRVEDLLTAVSGQANLSHDLIEIVLRDGHIPLTSVRGFRTVGDWLVEELRRELGSETGDRVAAEFARLLSDDLSDVSDVPGSLDSWLKDEFFTRHLKRTQGEPEVWHLASEHGTLQMLAYGRRLDQPRLNRLNTHVVRRKIDELQRRLREANEEDRIHDADLIESSLRDLHLFEVTLGMLQVGSSDEAKLVYPWRRSDQQPNGWAPVWTEGIRFNIAPLQRLGLLASPVLTDEELVSTGSI